MSVRPAMQPEATLSVQEAEAEHLLRTDEVARRLSISRRQVEALAATGKLPKIKIGAATRYEIKDVEAFIAKSKIGGPGRVRR